MAEEQHTLDLALSQWSHSILDISAPTHPNISSNQFFASGDFKNTPFSMTTKEKIKRAIWQGKSLLGKVFKYSRTAHSLEMPTAFSPFSTSFAIKFKT